VGADLRIFSVYTDGGFSRPSAEGLSRLDAQMATLLAANPKAYLLVRPMCVETPAAWAQEHPSELLTYEDGNTLVGELGAVGPGKPLAVSRGRFGRKKLGGLCAVSLTTRAAPPTPTVSWAIFWALAT
jgi:hypothetical protein